MEPTLRYAFVRWVEKPGDRKRVGRRKMQNFGRGGGRAWGAISGAYLLLSPPGMCNHHLPSDRVLVRAPQE